LLSPLQFNVTPEEKLHYENQAAAENKIRASSAETAYIAENGTPATKEKSLLAAIQPRNASRPELEDEPEKATPKKATPKPKPKAKAKAASSKRRMREESSEDEDDSGGQAKRKKTAKAPQKKTQEPDATEKRGVSGCLKKAFPNSQVRCDRKFRNTRR